MRQETEAALAKPARPSRWPAELRDAWNVERDAKAAEELGFLFKLGFAIALSASLFDFLILPELAAMALLLRVATIGPLTLWGMWLLARGRASTARAVVMVTMSLFAASSIWLSSYTTSDAMARISMAIVILLAIGVQVLPFSMQEKLRFVLIYCLASFLAGLFPNPLPPIMLLQHIIFSVIAGASGLMLAERLSQYEARDFLRGLQQQFSREDLERSNALLRELSESDPLTGLANRRSFERIFDEQSAVAGDKPLAMMMIDLDHFKDFNDRHGHQAGDRCLIEVARELERCLDRHNGLAARFGGEEFIVLVSEGNHSDAMVIAEEIRALLAELSIPTGLRTSSKITASIGVARSNSGSTMGEMIARADEALYRAKQRGRNRVEPSYAASEDLTG